MSARGIGVLRRNLAVAAVLALLGTSLLSGCSLMPRLRTPAAPKAAKEKAPRVASAKTKKPKAGKKAEPGREEPKLTSVQKKLADAAEQAALAPAEPYWPHHAAEILIEADSLREAEVSLRAALGRDARYAPSLLLLSRLYFESGRHEQAVGLLEPVVRASGANGAQPELAAALALHYDALDRVSDATEVIRGVSGDRRARPVAAYLALRSDRPDSARGLVEAAVDADGGSAANQNNAGIVKLRGGDADGARKAFLRAIDLDPRLAGPYYNLAILDKFYRFDDESAAKWFRSYWERSHQDPDSLRAQIELGEPKRLARDEDGR
jgi:tetratricopeptide (TPR) repeat protein